MILVFSVSLCPLGTNLGFELGCTGLGLGLGGIGTKGLGPGLDNKEFEHVLCKVCYHPEIRLSFCDLIKYVNLLKF